MAKGSRSHQRRRERRATISRKEGGLTALQALDMADDLDLAEGAAYAFAMEVSGLDHDSFFDELAVQEYAVGVS